MGPANLLYAEETGYESTMVGFPYDDIDGWRGEYPLEVFEKQFELLSQEWKKGLDVLISSENDIDRDRLANFARLRNVAVAAYCHFTSVRLQTRFNRLRKCTDEHSISEIRRVLDEEIDLAKTLHSIVLMDSTIGFEASNHYAYTANDLIEKILNCEHIKEKIKVDI